MKPIWWAVLTACIWGVVPVMEKIGLARTDAITGLFFRTFGAILGMIILVTFMVKPHELRSLDWRSITLFTLSGFLASFVAMLCFYKGLRLGDVSKIVPVSASYPLIAFVLGLFFLGETLSFSKVAGCSLIMFGIWLLKVGPS